MLVLSLAALLALTASVAQAETPKLVSYGQLPRCSEAEAAEGNCKEEGKLATPVGVAVDQSSSNVYVAGLLDFTNEPNLTSNVNGFSASGRLLSPPSPFAEGYNASVAVNPTNHDVYVLRAGGFGPTAIETFDPSSGASVSSFPVPEMVNFAGLFTVVQIAADSAGNVYVPDPPENEVLKYGPSGTLLQTFTGSGAAALSGPTGVAVDSSGSLWIADDGNNRVEELDSSGVPVEVGGKRVEIESEGVEAVALDAHGDVFAVVRNSTDFCGSLVPPCAHLVEYDSAGAQIADIGAGLIGAKELTVPSMLAVDGSSGRVYVTDGANNRVLIFGPTFAPALGRELSAEVSASEAKLGALVNPGGLETAYRFEYGTTEAYDQRTPFPEGNAGEGVTPRTVWASASGLQPGTTYHYRVVVTSELGTVAGPDQTFTTETSAQAACPNEQLRGGFSASLPDCRAYELVTTPTKTSSQPDSNFFGETGYRPGNHAAREGERMSYLATEILPGSQSGGFSYVATRGVSGWSSENVLPRQSYTADRCPLHDAEMQAYSANLARGVLFDGGNETVDTGGELHGGCGASGVEVVQGEPLGFENLLLRDNTNGTYQLINLPPPGVAPASAHFQGASSDLSHVVFDEHAQLMPDAPAGADNLYEWSAGAVRLVTVLPDGTPVAGSLAAGPGQPSRVRAVSADGSHVFFNADGNLYMRLNGRSTVQVDRPHGGSGPGGGGSFWDASADGSRVFFTDDASAGLTNDTVANSGANLYEYDVEDEALTDLTPVAKAEVGGVVGIGEDGSHAYFLAEGSLAAGARDGQDNLYAWRDGTTTLIATLDRALDSDAAAEGQARVSPDGAFLAFTSLKSLTGYDNTDANTEFPDSEVFLYSAGSGQLVCASCDPSGRAPASGGATLHAPEGGSPHYLSDGGRLFFDTGEPLLPADTNSQTDVYEYEGGQLHLISTGTSSTESSIQDASESGDDVFFLTRQQLVPQDTNEEALNIYDAHVDGGFPAPSSPPQCGTAESCRSAPVPEPSIFGAPSSETFSGAGNPPPRATSKRVARKTAKCRKGSVKKKRKCVRRRRVRRRRGKRAEAGTKASNHRRTAS